MKQFHLPVHIQTYAIGSKPVHILFPRVIGLTNRAAEQQINHTIYQTVIEQYNQQMSNQMGELSEMTGHYEIKTNERGILSLLLSNYTFYTPSAHGMTLVKSLTFDIQTGKLFSLEDLFKTGADYEKILTEEVQAQIKKREIPTLEPVQTIRPDQDYYLADKSLVLYFQLYEITPYVVGFPMFPISVYDLQSIAYENGPLSILAADIR